MDSRNDSFASLVTIASALVFLIFHKSLDAYAGIFTSIMILKAGSEVLKNTISDLLGRPGEKDLAILLYKEIRSTDGVLGAADMMLHNYGPDSYSGSVNIEIDHEKTVGDVYRTIHDLQLRIMHEYHVTMVFGIYAVDNDHPELRQLRGDIAQFCRTQSHIKSFHAVYLEPGSNTIYCDFIVDYSLHDWDSLKAEFTQYMAERYPAQGIELTIETEFV